MWSAAKSYRPKLAVLGLDLMPFIICIGYIISASLKLIICITLLEFVTKLTL